MCLSPLYFLLETGFPAVSRKTKDCVVCVQPEMFIGVGFEKQTKKTPIVSCFLTMKSSSPLYNTRNPCCTHENSNALCTNAESEQLNHPA